MAKFELLFVLILSASCTCAPVNQSSPSFWCRLWSIFCSDQSNSRVSPTTFSDIFVSTTRTSIANIHEESSYNTDGDIQEFVTHFPLFAQKRTTVAPLTNFKIDVTEANNDALFNMLKKTTSNNLVDKITDSSSTQAPPCTHHTPPQQSDDLRVLEDNDSKSIDTQPLVLITAPVTCLEGQSKDISGKCRTRFSDNGSTSHQLTKHVLVLTPCRDGYKADKSGVCRKVYSK